MTGPNRGELAAEVQAAEWGLIAARERYVRASAEHAGAVRQAELDLAELKRELEVTE